MKEVTFYVANDGTQFDDEVDCMKYEASLIAELDGLKAYTSRLEEIELKDKDLDGLSDVIEIACYLKIVDANKATVLFDIMDDIYGITHPTMLEDGQIWTYSEETDGWEELTKWLEELRVIVGKINEDESKAKAEIHDVEDVWG